MFSLLNLESFALVSSLKHSVTQIQQWSGTWKARSTLQANHTKNNKSQTRQYGSPSESSREGSRSPLLATVSTLAAAKDDMLWLPCKSWRAELKIGGTKETKQAASCSSACTWPSKVSVQDAPSEVAALCSGLSFHTSQSGRRYALACRLDERSKLLQPWR